MRAGLLFSGVEGSDEGFDGVGDGFAGCCAADVVVGMLSTACRRDVLDMYL